MNAEQHLMVLSTEGSSYALKRELDAWTAQGWTLHTATDKFLFLARPRTEQPDSDYARQAAAIHALERFHAQRGEFLSELQQAVLEETGSSLHGHLRSAEEAAQTILGDPTRLLTPSLVLVMDAAATLGPLTRRATRNYLMEAHYWASTVLDEPPTYTLS